MRLKLSLIHLQVAAEKDDLKKIQKARIMVRWQQLQVRLQLLRRVRANEDTEFLEGDHV